MIVIRIILTKKEKKKSCSLSSYLLYSIYILLFRSWKTNKEKYTSIMIFHVKTPTSFHVPSSKYPRRAPESKTILGNEFVLMWSRGERRRRLSLVFGLSPSALKIARWKLWCVRVHVLLNRRPRVCETRAFNVCPTVYLQRGVNIRAGNVLQKILWKYMNGQGLFLLGVVLLYGAHARSSCTPSQAERRAFPSGNIPPFDVRRHFARVMTLQK